MRRSIVISAGLGISALLLMGSTVFASGITISSNGAFSYNKVQVKSYTSSVVGQSNSAKFKNNVGINSSTGGNDANKNTGGSVSITTGDAVTNADITNQANANSASDTNSACCPCSNPAEVTVNGNGAYSYNKVEIKSSCSTTLVQSNEAYFKNSVWTNSSTGGNDANKNTGGDVTVNTGSLEATVTISNSANVNTAN